QGVSCIEGFFFQVIGERGKSLCRTKNGEILRQFCARLLDFNFTIVQRGATHHRLLSTAWYWPTGPSSSVLGSPRIDALNASAISPATSLKPSACKPRSSAALFSFSPAFIVACFNCSPTWGGVFEACSPTGPSVSFSSSVVGKAAASAAPAARPAAKIARGWFCSSPRDID